MQRARAQEVGVLLVGAEAHHALDAGAVVPTAVEEHDLAGRGQVRDVPLEVPLRALAFGGRTERDDACEPRVEPLHDPLDRAALAGGVAAFEDHDDAQTLVHDPLLHPHELDLQARELLLVAVLRHDDRLVIARPRLRHPANGRWRPVSRALNACTIARSISAIVSSSVILSPWWSTT